MAGRMPVLRQDHIVEARDQAVDRIDDRVAVGYGERAARTKIVLHVDHDQGRVGISNCPLRGEGHQPSPLVGEGALRLCRRAVEGFSRRAKATRWISLHTASISTRTLSLSNRITL